MQDWITDNHEAFLKTLKTAMEIHAHDFNACAACEQHPWFIFFKK